MMQFDPVTGPLTREKLSELVRAPHGQALKEIRKFDPLFGLMEGELIEWRVRASRRAPEDGFATVKADSLEAAKKLAGNLKESDFCWDARCVDVYDFDIEEVEPA
jgi:hypothetical protein